MAAIEVKEWAEHRGPILDSVAGFEVIECQSCGFNHVIPIPTLEELGRVYREDYYATEKPLYLERYREDLSWWESQYAVRYQAFETYLPTTRRRIVDIGSGPGFFLRVGRQRGWRTLGLEPSRQAAQHARELGLEIVEEFLTTENAASFGTFDVVHMYNVLEHVPTPRALLGAASGLLEPGGVLCVTVPNDYNPLQQILRDRMGFEPWWVVPPHHINYFSHASLQGLVRSCGFEVLEATTTFPMELFLLMGDNYVGNDQLGRQVHGKRKQLELAFYGTGAYPLLNRIYSGLADQGIGRECVVICRKPAESAATEEVKA